MKLRRCVYTYVGSVLLLVAAVWAVCALVQQRNYGRLAELERRQSDLTTDSCRLQLQAFEQSFLSGKGKALRNKIAAGNLLERGENDLADSLCRQSLRYFDFFTRDSVRIAHLYLLSGRIERARGNWLGAVDALLDAKAYGTSMPDDDEFAYRVHERLAFLYRENGLPDRERDCLREALIYARRLGKGDYVADGLRRLACLEGNVRTVQPSVRQLTEAKDSACANRQEQLAGQLQLLSDYRRWRKDADRAEYKVVLRGRALYRTLAVMLAVMAVLLTIYFYDRRRRLVAENRLLAEQTRREQERMDREQLRMDYYRQLNQLTLPMAYDRLREGKVRMGGEGVADHLCEHRRLLPGLHRTAAHDVPLPEGGRHPPLLPREDGDAARPDGSHLRHRQGQRVATQAASASEDGAGRLARRIPGCGVRGQVRHASGFS